MTSFRAFGRKMAREVRASPVRLAFGAATVALTAFVIAYPLAVTRYAPMTDLPFHAAQTSIFRHYLDPAFHFREQFELQPFAVPYMTQYAVGAFLMLFLPATTAAGIAAGVMLALLPAGLAILLWGQGKSPLGCVACLPLVWGGLTQWGFVSFLGALGLFAMALGVALSLLREPSRAKQIALGAVLVGLFFTHIFRFPFAIAGVLGATAVCYPVTRRIRPVVVPVACALALFAVWWVIRPAPLAVDFGPFDVHLERFDEIEPIVFGGFRDPAEPAIASSWVYILLLVAAGAVIARFALRDRGEAPTKPEGRRFRVAAGIAVAGSVAAFAAMFATLPMQAGIWWYIYPREAVAAAYLALALLPGLPKHAWTRGALLVALAWPAVRMTSLVARHYAAFDRSTEDFHAITRSIPSAPRLLYLVFDHGGSGRSNTPYIHLPAYVQAERGGWLSFHFASWGASPVVYRSDAAPGTLPPPTPVRWEWTPQRFRVLEHGAFFDWFLIRHASTPDGLLAADPTIERVDHVGTWWLYRRGLPPTMLTPR